MDKLVGTVHDVQTQSGTSDKGEWTRTTVVVETSSKYNNLVPVSFFNPDFTVNKGDSVEIDYYVGGREYQGKYFAQIDGSTLRVTSSAQKSTTSEKEKAFAEEKDDLGLPF